jgi:hypothetical protein
VKQGGMVAGYHNHNGEFDEKLEGRPQYDLMLEHLDPSLVKMQFQVAAITSGYKAQDYFRKFPGRFISAHLQDYAPDDHKKEVVMGAGIGFVDAHLLARRSCGAYPFGPPTGSLERWQPASASPTGNASARSMPISRP